MIKILFGIIVIFVSSFASANDCERQARYAAIAASEAAYVAEVNGEVASFRVATGGYFTRKHSGSQAIETSDGQSGRRLIYDLYAQSTAGDVFTAQIMVDAIGSGAAQYCSIVNVRFID